MCFEMAGELKERGNEEFKKGRLPEAVALYTEAIGASLSDKALLGTILTNRYSSLHSGLLMSLGLPAI